MLKPYTMQELTEPNLASVKPIATADYVSRCGVYLEDWQVRLVLRIMNTAALHYPSTVSSAQFSDIETLRAKLESAVGAIDNKII